MNFQKAAYVDMDGTLVPGTEVRNRTALQTMVDAFTAATGKNQFMIPWDLCNGQDEKRIHEILIAQGLEDLEDYITAPDFQKRAKQAYGEVEDVDLSPRPGMINILQFLKNYGVTPVLVTNSLRDSAEKTLEESFKIHSQQCGKLVRPEEVFPVIITKTEVLEAELKPKPSPDPFELAEQKLKARLPHNLLGSNHYKPTEFHYPRETSIILEDSGTGTEAGFAHTGNKSQTIQFIDMATPCLLAGHHVQDMPECAMAMCDIYGIPETNDQTGFRSTMMRIAMR